MRSILQALFMTLLLPLTANANLLYNGDFEIVDNRTGTYAHSTDGGTTALSAPVDLNDLGAGKGWGVFNSLPGWTTLYGNGIEVQKLSGVNSAQSGDYHIELDVEPNFRFPSSNDGSNSGMFQSVSGLNVGENYQLSFWYKSRSTNTNDNGINVYWYDGAASYTASTSLARSFVDVFVNDWTQYTFNLTATNSIMNVGFGAFGSYWDSNMEIGLPAYTAPSDPTTYSESTGDGLGGLLDNMSLEVAPIPEPASVLMVLSGLTLMNFARRRSIV